jgi:transposase
MKRAGRSLEIWFWSRINICGPQDCWEWNGHLDYKGYGRFWNGQKLIGAHRFAYLQEHGSLAEGLCVCHKCDVRRCCNPAHLIAGDYAFNNRDRKNKGRSAIGEKVGAAKLDAKQVRYIKRTYRPGKGVELANQFDVSHQTIYDIVNGRYWSHIKTANPQKTCLPTGEANKNAVMDKKKVKELRRLREKYKWRLNRLASKFGISISAAYQIANRITWKHIS